LARDAVADETGVGQLKQSFLSHYAGVSMLTKTHTFYTAFVASAHVLALPLLAQRVVVDKNVQVSVAHRTRYHQEIQIAAHPTDPNQLIACGIRYIDQQAPWESAVILYRSKDGGATWSPSFEWKIPNRTAGDPSCAYGPDGAAYFDAFAFNMTGRAQPQSIAWLFKSTDGGTTWRDSVEIHRTDPQFVTVDWTNGPYAGRIYVEGAASVPGMTSQSTRSSLLINRIDSKTMRPLQSVNLAAQDNRIPAGVGPSVVLSDGTVVISYGAMDMEGFGIVKRGAGPTGIVGVVTSSDGGATWNKEVIVADVHAHSYSPTNNLATVAADITNGPFKDRLYVAWNDDRTGRALINVAYSSDKGKTWSIPVAIREVEARPGEGKGPDDFMPTLAVNRDGVVGLTWYDRRDNSDNLGWTVRFAASLDGGDTWIPSVKVSEVPYDPMRSSIVELWALTGGGGVKGMAGGGLGNREVGRNATLNSSIFLDRSPFLGGDYAGLAPSADGAFHPVWIDNRDGVSQMWTTRVRVDGKAVVNGGPNLSTFVDVTRRVTLELVNLAYDRRSSTVTGYAYIRNESSDTIDGPIKARVLELTSGVGTPRLVGGIENSMTGTGAVLDFTPLVSDSRLLPGGQTGLLKISVRLANPKPLAPESRGAPSTNFVYLRTKVLAARASK
jgi:hypothetical protein